MLDSIVNLWRKVAQMDLPRVPRWWDTSMSHPTNAAQTALKTTAQNIANLQEAQREYWYTPTVTETIMYWTPLSWVPFAVGAVVDWLSFPVSQVRNVYNTAADAINAWVSIHNKNAYDRRLEARSKIIWELDRMKNAWELLVNPDRAVALINLYNKIK